MRQLQTILTFIFLWLTILVLNTSCKKQSVNNKTEKSLHLLWSYNYDWESGYSISSLRPELVGEQSVIISPDRMLYRIQATDGKLVWKVPATDSSMISSKRLLFDSNYLYIKADLNKNISAIDIENGQTEWSKSLPEQAPPFYDLNADAIYEDELYLTGRYGNMHKLDKSGNYLSSHRFPPSLQSLTSNNSSLLISQGWKLSNSDNHFGQVLSINPTKWDTLWTFTTNEGGFYYSPPIIQNQTYFNGTAEGPGSFVALDVETGQVKWELKGYWCYRFTLGDGKIFINDSNYILAVDKKTGEVLWEDYFQGHTESNLAYLNGYLYHTHNGGLYVWDAQNGDRVAGPIESPDGSDFYNLNAGYGKLFIQSQYSLYAYEAWK